MSQRGGAKAASCTDNSTSNISTSSGNTGGAVDEGLGLC
jgi:hypothetical protein